MSTPYVPPGAAGGSEPSQSTPQASGYTPPDSAGAQSRAAEPAPGYTPPGGATPKSGSTPQASGYTPPSVGGPRSAEPPRTPGASGNHVPEPPRTAEPAQPQPPTTVPDPSAPTEPPQPGRLRIVLIAAVVVAVLVIVLIIAALSGAFSPKMARLPATVGQYRLDESTRKSSTAVLDSATYRAGAGDIFTARIIKNAPDPSIAYNNASSASRYAEGNVYCVEVSAKGKGGSCDVLLPSGSAVRVEASNRHPATQIAQLARDVAAGVT